MVIQGCTRCGGDLFDEEMIGQVDLVCLQRGFRRTVFPSVGVDGREIEVLMRSF